jgi:multidrug efflux pump subunit AcrA (membrane-fusion protein)
MRHHRLFVFLQAVAFASCAHGNSPAPAPADPPPRTVPVVEGRVAPSVTLSGLIAPFENVAISSTLTEPAQAVYVREGDYVRAGQPLAQLDTADLQANYVAAIRNAEDARAKVAQARDQGVLNVQQGRSDLESAKSDLVQAQQKLQLAEVTLKRDQELYKQGYLSHQVLDNDATQYQNDQQAVASARAAVRTAMATVIVNGDASRGLQRETVTSAQAAAASAFAQADQIAVQIRKAGIVSPTDGIVINRNINVGQYPGNAQIFTIQHVRDVYAMLNASSDQVFLVRPGSPAQIQVGALHGYRTRGVVEAVLGQAQPGATNFVVKVRIPNDGGKLQSGMVVNATIKMPAVAGTMIPSSAFIDAAHDAVRTQDGNGSTRVVTVRAVAEDGTHSIVQGLSRGTRVIVQAQ